MMEAVRVTPWVGSVPPDEAGLRELIAREGLTAHTWSNGPGDAYAAHSHDYNKVIYVVRGAITFGLPRENRELSLQAGDRLDLPAGTVHDAAVGAMGVVCLEAHC